MDEMSKELRRQEKWNPGYLTIHLPTKIFSNRYYSRQESVKMMIVMETEISHIIDVINKDKK